MSIEVRPVSILCNLSCKYCYQHPQRDLKNYSSLYDLDKIKKVIEQYNDNFTLFGGEPLLMNINDLEAILQLGFNRFNKNTIQTNGVLISERHIELFKKYNVDVGISIDGPKNLNDNRWAGSLEKTRKVTEKTNKTIVRLCEEGITLSLIITLHRGNSKLEKLPQMHEWIKFLDKLGIKSVRLHLLEVENKEVHDSLSLSAYENIEALISFIELEKGLKNIRFDITTEIRNLLLGIDTYASCAWRACDPYSTLSVLGIEGDGTPSKCGRVNKDGIDYLRPLKQGYERYIALYNTPQLKGGCRNCRFFLFCKGQCPGTAIDGDWRNKTEHCEVWRYLFMYIEKQLILEGQTPFSIHPARKILEKNLLEQWKRELNPPITALSWKRKESDTSSHTFIRYVWVSEEEKSKWLAHSSEDKLLGFVEDSISRSNFNRIISDNIKNGIRIITVPKAKIITYEI